MSEPRFRISILLVLLGCAITMPALARADEVYTYTGNPFNLFNNTAVYACPPECSISGSFTVPTALPSNLNFMHVTPVTFSFTDGNTTWTPSDILGSPGIEISTNASGTITNWELLFVLNTPLQPFMLTQHNSPTVSCGGCTAGDSTENNNFGTSPFAFAANINDPGTWTASPTQTAVPEPESLLLLGMGLACMAGVRRKLLG